MRGVMLVTRQHVNDRGEPFTLTEAKVYEGETGHYATLREALDALEVLRRDIIEAQARNDEATTRALCAALLPSLTQPVDCVIL